MIRPLAALRRPSGPAAAGRLVAVVLAAALAAGPAAAGPPTPQGAADYIAKADYLQRRGDTAGAVAALKEAARLGGSTRAGARAKYLLGLAEVEGRAPGGTAADGYKRLEEAAAAGSRDAAKRLLDAQAARGYKPSDPAAAAKTYERLAATGSTSAAIALGDLKASGALGARDLAAAEKLYGQAAATSNNGKRRLALLRAARGDEAGALAALQGLETRSLADVYRDMSAELGRGAAVPRNAAMAARFAARANALDPPRAKTATARTKKAPGLSDIPLAALTAAQVEALRAAARNGDAGAAARLADAIEAGVAVGTPGEIVALRTIAVAKGRADVSDGLVRALGTADFAAPDSKLAVETLLRAANGGSADAMAALGRLYAAGGPVDPDLAASTRWYQRAAEKGITEAQFRTGMAYAGGLGVVADEAAARRWLDEAAGGGHALARVTLAQLGAGAAAPKAATP